LAVSICLSKKLKYLLTSDTDVIRLLQNFHLDMKARTKSYFGIHILDRCHHYCFCCFFKLFPIIRNISFLSLQSQSQWCKLELGRGWCMLSAETKS